MKSHDSNKLLPGGMILGGTLKRSYKFKPIDGELEMALQECLADWQHCYQPDLAYQKKVIQILELVIESFDSNYKCVDVKTLEKLSLGDRDFLLLSLLQYLSAKPIWLTSECEACDALMDVFFLCSDLPVISPVAK